MLKLPISKTLTSSILSSALAQEIKHAVDKKGHLLLRGLTDLTPKTFEQQFNPIVGNFVKYELGTNCRDNLSQNVITPGTEPHFMNLSQHNEMSYTQKWPKYFALTCFGPPKKGQGMTVITDNVKVTDQLPKEITDKYIKHGVMYFQKMTNKNIPRTKFFYNDWQDPFFTEDKKVVEKKCEDEGYQYEWDSQDNLTVKYVKPSHIFHPETKQLVYFNCGFSMIKWFDDWYPYSEQPRNERPFSAAWGNGEDFTDRELNQIEQVYQDNMMGSSWEKGDVLILENHFTTHGRTAYEANSDRRLGVMMGTAVKRLGLKQTTGVSETAQN